MITRQVHWGSGERTTDSSREGWEGCLLLMDGLEGKADAWVPERGRKKPSGPTGGVPEAIRLSTICFTFLLSSSGHRKPLSFLFISIYLFNIPCGYFISFSVFFSPSHSIYLSIYTSNNFSFKLAVHYILNESCRHTLKPSRRKKLLDMKLIF